MISVKGTKITMTRGDTFRATITIKDSNGAIYVPQANDQIKFTAKKNLKSEEALIQKTIPNDTLLLELAPNDTKSLEMEKTYVYDIQLTKANGDVDTFISKAELEITGEVG